MPPKTTAASSLLGHQLTDFAQPGSHGDGGHLRVLLVEDQTPLKILLTMWLERHGYCVQSAESLREADAYTGIFDVLLADVWLPDGLGLSILRSRPQQFRFGGISLSGFGAPEDFEQSKAAGFRFHLVKPFSPEELHTKIQMLVHGGKFDP